MVLCVEEVFIARVWLEPEVVVAVFFKRDIDDDALCMLAPVEHLEPVRVVDPGLGRTGAAAAGQG
jgi:hypothetical protein